MDLSWWGRRVLCFYKDEKLSRCWSRDPVSHQREGPGLPPCENALVSSGTLVLVLRDGGRFMPDEVRHVSDSFCLCAAGFSPLSD